MGTCTLRRRNVVKTNGNLTTRFDNERTAMSLQVLGGMPTEVFQGVAPGPHPAVKVPFVIARRKGVDVEFITLLIPSKGDAPKTTARIGEARTILVHGRAGWIPRNRIIIVPMIVGQNRASIWRPLVRTKVSFPHELSVDRLGGLI
jgi:hypothetical protein